MEELSFNSKELGREVNLIIDKKGNPKKLFILLEPYGFHPRKPFLALFSPNINDYVIAETDGSLGIPCNIRTNDEKFKGLMKGSWYYGKYENYVLEVADYLKEIYSPEETIIGGASMGGWGALNIGVKYPERFDIVIASSAPAFFGKSFFNVKDNVKLLKELVGTDEDTAYQYFNDMLETMDSLYTGGSLLREYREKGIINERLYEKWKENFPINVIEKNKEKARKLRLVISVNWYDKTTFLSDVKLHEKLVELDVPHNYVVFLGSKEASHFNGMFEGLELALKLFYK